jgi:hypothetical protein
MVEFSPKWCAIPPNRYVSPPNWYDFPPDKHIVVKKGYENGIVDGVKEGFHYPSFQK